MYITYLRHMLIIFSISNNLFLYSLKNVLIVALLKCYNDVVGGIQQIASIDGCLQKTFVYKFYLNTSKLFI